MLAQTPASPTPDAPTPDLVVSLKGAIWLADEHLQRLMRAIAGSDEDVRVVGGAIRNALMGREIADIDLATTATPAIVMARARDHDMKPVPTGIDHGTITVVVNGKPFEVTTLREDVATDGRHATVKFGRGWDADAMRRDFTVNALYATAGGDIIDLVGGIADCRARRIRFIGDPDARIREDYLRILRLFRFHATFCDGPIDPPGLAAAVRLREGLLTLSPERIGQEILKLVIADHAPDVLEVMRDTGILSLALGTDAIGLERFSRLHALVTSSHISPTIEPPPNRATLLLASLASGSQGCEQLAKQLRLSNAMRDRMMTAWIAATSIVFEMSDRAARALMFRIGVDTYRDGVFISASTPGQDWPAQRVANLLHLCTTFKRPRPPVSGSDLLALGILPGPDFGRALQSLTDRWIDSDFILTKAELLADASKSPD